MAGKNQVTLTFAGDSSDLERAFRRVGLATNDLDRNLDGVGGRISDRSRSWGASLLSFGSVAAVGLGVAAAGAVSFGMSMVKAAEESAQVTKQTEAVISSMGASAWTSSKQVAELAEQLSNKTGIDDELIQSGQNVLLTFGNIRNEVGRGNAIFDRATTAALDMSVALGTDLQSSVTQVGKALNDPIAGITALTRVGVQFTDEQKNMIATLVESGDTLGAQRVILEELERQFSGSAEAQATASQRMSTAWGNLQETIGEKLLPAFTAITDWLIADGIPWFESFAATVQERVVPVLQEIWAWIQTNVVPVLVSLAAEIRDDVLPALQDFWLWIQEKLVPMLQQMWRFIQEDVIPTYQALAQDIRDDLMPALQGLYDALVQLFGGEKDSEEGARRLGESWEWLGVIAFGTADGLRVVVQVLDEIVDAMAAVVRWTKQAVDWLDKVKIPGTGGGGKGGLGIGSALIAGGGTMFMDIFRAAGGPVSAGRSYVVGEEGPEVFTPGRSGMITANNATLSLADGGGSGFASVVYAIRDAAYRSLQWFFPFLSTMMKSLSTITVLLGQQAVDAGHGDWWRRYARDVAAGDFSSLAPKPFGGAPVNVHVQGSIVSERDIVRIIRDEIARGGLR